MEKSSSSNTKKPTIRAAAIVGRKGQLLYLDDFGADFADAILFEQAIFASLDHISERFPERTMEPSATSKGGNAPFDPFLGLILPFQGFKTLAYVTVTDIKIILVTKDLPLREDKMRELFKKLHQIVVNASCNPFIPFDIDASATAAEATPKMKQSIAQAVSEAQVVAA